MRKLGGLGPADALRRRALWVLFAYLITSTILFAWERVTGESGSFLRLVIGLGWALIAAQCVVKPLWEAYRAEREAAELARQAAADSERAKARFLANMSHELRTPLNGICGMVSVLRETDLNAEQFGFLETIASSADGLVTRLTDVVDFAELERNQVQLELSPMRIDLVLEGLVSAFAPLTFARPMEILSVYPPELTVPRIGDANRLRQALSCLLSNACHFTDQGQVLLRALPEANGVRFEVIDTGRGIAADRVAALFEPFTQLDDSSTRSHGGLGIGLTLARRLIQLMGGELEYVANRDEQGREAGSVFRFCLPLASANGDAQPSPRVCLHGMRLALYSGSGSLRQHLEAHLMAAGAATRIFATHNEVVRALIEGETFDFVIVDHDARDEVSAELPLPARMPRIIGLLSGQPHESQRQGLNQAIWRSIPKPVWVGTLLDTLQVESSERSDTAVGPNPTDARKLRILVVEDNPVNLKVCTRVLEQFGHEVSVALDGKQAIEMWNAGDYELVLMDCQLPVMDGYQATQEIRRLEEDRDATTPIVAFTANVLARDIALCVASGMDGIVAKPLDRSRMELALTAVCRGEPIPDPWLSESTAA